MTPESRETVASDGIPSASVIAVGGTRQNHSEEGLRLLLLEDDDALRQMLDWEFAEFGYRVHSVASCREARAVGAGGAFDLALFDVGLPDGDGAALAAELMHLNASLKVILCSGRPGTLNPERVPPGVIACLTKPVSVDRINALFRAAL